MDARRVGKPLFEAVEGLEYVADLAWRKRAGAGTAPLLSWELVCRAPGGEARVWAQPVPLGQRLVRYRSAVTIPAGCDTQVWRLRALAPDRQTPATFRLARVDLEQGR